MLDAFGEVNWPAVIVAGLAYYGLGAVWYTNALFGRQYRTALGLDGDAQGSPDPVLLGVNLIGWLLASLALALVIVGTDSDGFVDGLVAGLVVSIGIVGVHQVVNAMYDGRGMGVVRIHIPYSIVGFALMGAILGAWR